MSAMKRKTSNIPQKMPEQLNKRKIIIQGKVYDSLESAAKAFGRTYTYNYGFS